MDPTKKGFVETKNVVNYLVTKINDVKSFGIGSVKLQKSWFKLIKSMQNQKRSNWLELDANEFFIIQFIKILFPF